MINANTILRYLPTYKGDVQIITDNQSVEDIMQAMQIFHKKYAGDYDKIYQFFVSNTPEKTAKKLFDFLKQNCSYNIEGIEKQTVRNPSAILATKKIDCKNYALFIGGIIDAINRSGQQNIPFAYRFAQTDQFDNSYNHVFIVVNPKTHKEIFIDPIPEVKKFDDRFPIYSYTDKNYSKMLYGISGQSQMGLTIPVIGVDTKDIAAVANILSSLFPGSDITTDWIGWNQWEIDNNAWKGSAARGYVLNDGDDIKREAINIVNYIKKFGLSDLTSSGHPVTIDGQGWRDVTIDEIITKITRGGYGNEAAAIRASVAPGTSSNFLSNLFNINQPTPTPGTPTPIPGATASTMASMNIYVTLALAAGAIYFIIKMKK